MTAPSAPTPPDGGRVWLLPKHDPVDAIYGLRDVAAAAAEKLRPAVAEAVALLERLDRLAEFYEDAAQLVAASDLAKDHHANVPPAAGLVRQEPSR